MGDINNDWIVDAIPGLHRTYANLGDDGEWVYWEPMADGRWKWNPKWVVYDNAALRNILSDLESEWMDLRREEDEKPEMDRTDEWYQSIMGRKLSLDTMIVYYQQRLGINNN